MIDKKDGIVLVVDDESQMCDLCDLLFEDLGYKTRSFLDGFQALNWFKNNKDLVSVAFIDMVLPLIDGLQLKKDLLHIRKDLKIIWMSAYIDLIDGPVLKKPFTATDLLQILKEV